MKTKICTKCGKEKFFSEFYKDNQKKDNLSCSCKDCKNQQLQKYASIHKKEKANYDKQRHKKYPWKKTYSHIKERCENINCKQYMYYGGRGIECRITEEELKKLWFRDKAYEMKKPSIDRINNDGHYEYDNCRFIEMSENIHKKHVDNKTLKSVLQYDLEGNFIREWESIRSASKALNIYSTLICKCCKNKLNKTGGFIWKYKNEN